MVTTDIEKVKERAGEFFNKHLTNDVETKRAVIEMAHVYMDSAHMIGRYEGVKESNENYLKTLRGI